VKPSAFMSDGPRLTSSAIENLIFDAMAWRDERPNDGEEQIAVSVECGTSPCRDKQPVDNPAWRIGVRCFWSYQ
jgi:hypothetical protein